MADFRACRLECMNNSESKDGNDGDGYAIDGDSNRGCAAKCFTVVRGTKGMNLEGTASVCM